MIATTRCCFFCTPFEGGNARSESVCPFDGKLSDSGLNRAHRDVERSDTFCSWSVLRVFHGKRIRDSLAIFPTGIVVIMMSGQARETQGLLSMLVHDRSRFMIICAC